MFHKELILILYKLFLLPPLAWRKVFVITYKVSDCYKVNTYKVNTVNESANTEAFMCIGILVF